jgi:hypothetical protein
MEHRCGERQLLNIEAVARCRALGRVRVRIRDASIGGLFVEMPTTGIAPNVPLELGFIVNGDARPRPYRIQGLVTRITKEGVGLYFGHLTPDAQVALLVLLRRAPPHRSP